MEGNIRGGIFGRRKRNGGFMILVSYAKENGFGDCVFDSLDFPVSADEKYWIRDWLQKEIKTTIVILNIIPLRSPTK